VRNVHLYIIYKYFLPFSTHPPHLTTTQHHPPPKHQGSWMRSHLTGEEVSSAFSRFYGSMDIIPFLGDNFNRVFPIFIAILAVFQARVWDCVCKCMAACIRLCICAFH
jgi:hypothetical protein